jgi:hypothetical protein
MIMVFFLSKDIARVIIDDINTEGLQKIIIPPKNTRWGSLKTIENLCPESSSRRSKK